MIISKIRALTYLDSLIGLRFTLSDDIVLDADKQSLTRKGIYNINLEEQVPLNYVNDMFISDEELSEGVTTEDISENEERLNEIVSALQSDEQYKHLFVFQLPYQQSLKTFMEDDNWVAIPTQPRTDEHKNQHYMVQPDGTQWRGGWIGSAKNPQIAKEGFHYDQVRWAIHRGEEVSTSALLTYPDLKQYWDIILDIKQNIRVQSEENPLISITVDDTVKTFNLSEFPYDRITQRQYVNRNNLVTAHAEQIEKDFPQPRFFCMRELTIIALEHIASNYPDLIEQRRAIRYQSDY